MHTRRTMPALLRSAALKLLLAGTSALAVVALPAAAVPTDLAAWACTGACGAAGIDGDIVLAPTGNARYGYVTTAFSNDLGVSPLALDPNSRGGGTETNGSKYTSPSFTMAGAGQVDVWFNYVSTDGKGYDDYAWARLINITTSESIWLFAAESTNSGPKNIVPGKVLDKSVFDPDAVIVDYKDRAFNTRNASNPINWSLLGGSNGTCWKGTAEGCGFTGWMQSHVDLGAGSYRLEVGVVNWGDSAYDSGLAFDFNGLIASSVPEPATLPTLLAGLSALALIARCGNRRG